ncbi:UNVERIFIED_CONTAM: hypothetical protein PYX00_004547 [Menopon gallinae]|uniref:Chitin-binding type-2 domain-containing protein n=1 Tax=Menopon gallinae TaxID=328185 RepID=A0AAW2I4B8_9NEOP
MIFNILALVCFAAAATGQRRYYSLEDMPETNFDCRDKILGGYYADPEANCQMFHVCVKIPGQGVQDFRFLCPNETVFDQENQICADSGDIDCEAAGLYLENFDLYRIGSAPAKRPLFTSSKGTVLPLGPSTKSPILTNNINEEDEFYLQRSDTGDRRLHSKDLLRGSSSSNFFNNRNKGKDLEDDDDEEPLPKNTGNGQFRPRPNNNNNNGVRGKSQYNSQFRKVETTAQPQPTPQVDNQNQLDKKRTKIAVRKLARKRPEDEAAEANPPSPTYSSFTTQVTQRYNFGEQDSRYNTINRAPTTPPSVPTVTQQRFSQSFRPKNDQPSTPAFFEPSATPRSFANDQNQNGNFLRQPIVAAGANYQNNQNRASTNYQQPNRPTTANPQQNYPQNFQQNQNRPAGNFQQQQQQQNRPAQGNFQQAPRPNQPNNNNNNNNNINFQGPRAGQNNFQPPRTSQPVQPTTAPNFQRTNQAARTNQPVNNNFQEQRPSPTPNNVNFRQNQPGGFQGRTNVPQTARTNPPTNYQNDFSGQGNRQTTASLPPNTRAQSINNGLLARTPAQNRNFYNRDDFDEGDNQEFLKTAPSNNFRPSDLNSFQNAYKGENSSKIAQTSTTKYYTPTIVTTPRSPSTYAPTDAPATRQTNAFSTNQPSQNFYTQAVTRKVQQQQPQQQQPSSTARPAPKTFPPSQPASTKATEAKDTAYDYAYYDDGGSFSEYDTLGDSLGEDFSRTSQRSKSRLI